MTNTVVPRPCGHSELIPDTCGICKLYRDNHDVRSLWNARTVAGLPLSQSGTTSRTAVPVSGCPHLGEPTGATVGCRTCRGTMQLPVMRCALNPGGCVTGDRAPASDTVRACRWCPDHPARKVTTPRRQAQSVLASFPEKISWVSTAQLTQDTIALAGALPTNCSGVVGVPRSGMIPASILATQLHVPLGEIDATGQVRWLHHGNRGGQGLHRATGPIVVIDDTCYGGTAARRIRHTLSGTNYVLCAVYARPEAANDLDIYARPLPAPHLLEWNWSNNGPLVGLAVDPSYGMGIATDLDGILVHDEESGGKVGTLFMAPRMNAVRLIVTGRAERHRVVTEGLLNSLGIRWERLEMLPDDVPLSPENAAAHKAKFFGAEPYGFFMESCPKQAAIIRKLSNKCVICPKINKVFQ